MKAKGGVKPKGLKKRKRYPNSSTNESKRKSSIHRELNFTGEAREFYIVKHVDLCDFDSLKSCY